MAEQKLGRVLFFERNALGTFDCIGASSVLPFRVALDVYANTPNPASQLVEGTDVEGIISESNKMVKNMKDQKYVDEYVDPYL